jgi:hypothetical protein
MTIRITMRRRIALAAAVATTAAGVWAVSPTTADAATPPWQSAGSALHDPNAVGTLHFYNAAGTEIFGGSTTAAPIANYVSGSSGLRSGDTRAFLAGYLPTEGSNEGAWTGQVLTAATTYPVSSGPSAISALAVPVFSGSAADTSIDDLVTALPNHSTNANYAGVYELRLRTSAAGTSSGPSYDVADIKVTGTNWQVVYPANLTDTATALSASPASGAKAGDAVTLTATVTPSTAGTVQFLDGASALGSAVTVSAGKAHKTVTLTSARVHSLSAQFTPSDPGAFAGSSGSLNYTVGKATSTTTGTLPASTGYGTAWTLHATVTAKVPATGKVTVKNGSTVLAQRALSQGKAALAVPGTALAVGKHTLTVSYGGSGSVGSSSVSKTITITKAASKTSNTLAKATVTRTQHGTVSVTVSAPGGAPTGKVSVLEGTHVLTTATLASGNKGRIAVILPTLAVGKHQLHAAYAGSSTVAASTAGAVTLTVTK